MQSACLIVILRLSELRMRFRRLTSKDAWYKMFHILFFVQWLLSFFEKNINLTDFIVYIVCFHEILVANWEVELIKKNLTSHILLVFMRSVWQYNKNTSNTSVSKRSRSVIFTCNINFEFGNWMIIFYTFLSPFYVDDWFCSNLP